MRFGNAERTGAWALVIVAAALGGPAVAHAQGTGADDYTNTMGAMLQAATSDVWKPLWMLMLALAFLAGLWLVATGLLKLKDIGGHGQSSVMDGVMRIVGGAFLLGLPDIIGAGLATFYNTVTGHALNPGLGQVGGVTDCTQSTAAVTCVVKNVAVNVAPVFTETIFAALFLMGVLVIVRAIQDMATSHSARGQAQAGWGKKMVMGALMCNVPYLFSAIENTLGISNGTILSSGFNTSSNMLAYSASGSTVALQYTDLMNNLFRVLVMFGAIALWRGLHLIRAAADGNRQTGSVGQGLTFCLGGVALANMKWTICIVLSTFLGSSMGFCS